MQRNPCLALSKTGAAVKTFHNVQSVSPIGAVNTKSLLSTRIPCGPLYKMRRSALVTRTCRR